MQTILDEARESYDPQIVQELRSEQYEDLEGNVERVIQWLENWKQDHQQICYFNQFIVFSHPFELGVQLYTFIGNAVCRFKQQCF